MENGCSMRVLCIFLAVVAFLDSPRAARAEDDLKTILEFTRTKYQVPALAAAVVKDGKLIAAGAVGNRVAGRDLPVSVDDRFHLGSDTKAMTATLAGMMVDEGRLRWNSTIQEVLGPLLPGLRPRFGNITLRQLLSNTSGLPPDNEEIGRLYFSPDAVDHPPSDWRLKMISNWGSRHDPSIANVGKFQYANLGYVIAGAMIEKASGKPWERLMYERIFVPLGLKTAGLGAQATFGIYDAAVGHRIDSKGKVTPYPWGEAADLPAALGPAGLAHMSIKDFASWAGWNAGEGKRGPAILKPETLKLLHRPVVEMQVKDPKTGAMKTGSYALGWGLSKFDWTDKPLLTHNGSNGMNFASILIDPDRDLAIVVATNIAGTRADPATLEVMKSLYAKYSK